MKKTIYVILLILAVFSFSACEDYTDITPKGKNLLSTADELEYLLNCNFAYVTLSFDFTNLAQLDNDEYCYSALYIPTLVSGTVKDLNYALITYDESVDRAILTTTDSKYSGLYSIITTRLNMILDQASNVTDNPNKVKQLKAEALTLRAYLHYILVNIYAKAYNPSTAATDGGIAYMNYIDYETNPKKNTVAEVYEKMLSDINSALNLNSLPDEGVTCMRVGKGFAYAVKARILLSMRDYEGALIAADSSLSYNSILEDHRPFIATGAASRDAQIASNNLFLAQSVYNDPSFCMITKEILNDYYEAGNIIRYYTATYLDVYGLMFTGVNGSSCWYANNYQGNSGGMTTSDTYLIKAECLIRLGEVGDGLDVINYVRERRINPTDYTPLSATTVADAMAYLKKVSRIEFLATWKNFVNIKRWNTEDLYKENITRNINGTTYTLTPDSPLWIFPFPQSATNYNPNLTQNY